MVVLDTVADAEDASVSSAGMIRAAVNDEHRALRQIVGDATQQRRGERTAE